MTRAPIILLSAAILLAALPDRAAAQARTAAGDFSVEPATLLSLGFDWAITGDDNRNAHVEVTYRKKGETAWRNGLPLLRLQHEWVNGGPPQAPRAAPANADGARTSGAGDEP